MGKRVALECVS